MDAEDLDDVFNLFVPKPQITRANRQKKQPVLPTPACRHRVIEGFYPFIEVQVGADWLTIDEAVNHKRAPLDVRRHLLEIYDDKFTYECPTIAYPDPIGRGPDGYYYFSSVPTGHGPKTALFLGRCQPKKSDVACCDSAWWTTEDGVSHWVLSDSRRICVLEK